MRSEKLKENDSEHSLRGTGRVGEDSRERKRKDKESDSEERRTRRRGRWDGGRVIDGEGKKEEGGSGWRGGGGGGGLGGVDRKEVT